MCGLSVGTSILNLKSVPLIIILKEFTFNVLEFKGVM